MPTDTVLFLFFDMPFLCFIAAWIVFFGKRDGVLKMSWREVVITEVGLLFLAAASVIVAVAMAPTV
jgi:hypothetical protein